jgi:exopolysaccharide biosynthesis polyprenyl glycosylphosphotransferase
VLTFVGLTIERGVWRAVMRAARHDGRHVRPVLLLGANSDAQRLVRLYEDHPEYGFRVIGLLAGWEDAQRNHLGQMWMGTIDEVERIIDHHAVTGVVIAAGAVDADTGESIVRALHRRGVHVHWSTGMSGVSNARVRALPLAREPIFYLEAHRRSTADVAGKRAFDLIGAVAGVVLLAPVLLLIAAIVKFGDGGPVFYRQARVGRNGKIFKVIKFRTMRVDADRQLEALATLNERKGPLFKLERDPRVTRAGKFLRLSSLDELPQLFNVLRGEMSLVGPRPALPSEITQFDERLRGRDVVRPGITGLWQVEARDSPSFEAYRRLDLFYVENWSLWGDVAVLLDTVEHMVGRVYRAVRKDDTAPAVTTVVPAAVEPDSPIVRSA